MSLLEAGGPEFYDLYDGGDWGVGANIAFTDNFVLDLGYSSTSSNSNTADGGIFNDGSYIVRPRTCHDEVWVFSSQGLMTCCCICS